MRPHACTPWQQICGGRRWRRWRSRGAAAPPSWRRSSPFTAFLPRAVGVRGSGGGAKTPIAADWTNEVGDEVLPGSATPHFWRSLMSGRSTARRRPSRSAAARLPPPRTSTGRSSTLLFLPEFRTRARRLALLALDRAGRTPPLVGTLFLLHRRWASLLLAAEQRRAQLAHGGPWRSARRALALIGGPLIASIAHLPPHLFRRSRRGSGGPSCRATSGCRACRRRLLPRRNRRRASRMRRDGSLMAGHAACRRAC